MFFPTWSILEKLCFDLHKGWIGRRASHFAAEMRTRNRVPEIVSQLVALQSELLLRCQHNAVADLQLQALALHLHAAQRPLSPTHGAESTRRASLSQHATLARPLYIGRQFMAPHDAPPDRRQRGYPYGSQGPACRAKWRAGCCPTRSWRPSGS